ncbi:MAG: ATP-binding protein [Streptosporangiaceae bacterium]
MEPATAQPADTHPRTRTPRPPVSYPRQPDHLTGDLPGTATGQGYTGTFHGRPEEAARVRREIASYLNGCPAAADMVLIADELAANAILHSHSRGSSFRVRCQLSPGTARIEVEDMGGPWRTPKPDDRPHGLDIVRALTGHDGWGNRATGTGSRVTWARLSW